MSTMPEFRIIEKSQVTFEDRITCQHCGRVITWVYMVESTKTGESIILGSNCVWTVTGITPSQISHAWAEYESEIAQDELEIKRLAKVKEWKIANESILASLESLANGESHYLPLAEELVNKVSQFGTLTEKQLNMVNNIIAKIDSYSSRKTWENSQDKLSCLSMCKLSKYDIDFQHDLQFKSQTWGLTVNQVNAINKMFAKYHKQIESSQDWLMLKLRERITE